MPVLFIHGVTVTEDRYESLLTDVSNGIMAQRPGTVVGGVYWGDLASTLRFKGASIPGFIEKTKAFAGIDEEQVELVLMLLENPSHELELLTPPDDPDAPPPHLRPPLPRNEQLDNAQLRRGRRARRPGAGAGRQPREADGGAGDRAGEHRVRGRQAHRPYIDRRRSSSVR